MKIDIPGNPGTPEEEPRKLAVDSETLNKKEAEDNHLNKRLTNQIKIHYDEGLLD